MAFFGFSTMFNPKKAKKLWLEYREGKQPPKLCWREMCLEHSGE